MAIFAAVRAMGVWTISAGHLADAETVTFGGKVYTFRNTVGALDGSVYLPTGGDDAADVAAAANLIKAINLTGVAGTDYGTAMTKHTMVKAAAGSTTRKVNVSALVPGAAGNYIAFVDGTAQASVDAAVLGTGTSGTGSGHADVIAWLAAMQASMQVNGQLTAQFEQAARELA